MPTPTDVLNRGAYWIVFVRTGERDSAGFWYLKGIHVPKGQG